MNFTRLKAQNFRNFPEFSINPNEKLNVIYGNNGSGKTSLLETIYLMGHGRSFRSGSISGVIRHESEKLAVFGEWVSHTGRQISLGLEKNRREKQKIRIDGENAASISALAQYLPIQIVNPDGYRLLEDGPKYRRAYLDWGLFHVEHQFYDLWKRLQRCLAQRNAALKDPNLRSQARSWDEEFVKSAESVDEKRVGYIEALIPLIHDLFDDLIDLPEVAITYFRGWDQEKTLSEVLESHYIRDLGLGYTKYGPQRANLLFEIEGRPVEQVLSRGQQKLLVIAMRLAQGMLLLQQSGKHCLYLIDDIASELDPHRRQAVFSVLDQLSAQVFITGIERKDLKTLIDNYQAAEFHIEHDIVKSVTKPVELA